MARLSACSAEETRTSFAKPSTKIPAELRHTQAIDPSKDPGCNFGSGRCLLKTRLFLAFQISQRTTETSLKSVQEHPRLPSSICREEINVPGSPHVLGRLGSSDQSLVGDW
ncbi:uncharacterized protein LOC130135569 isoform X3 [Syzygium oleosum]|uniref:uncharacterized protein LOC130135569 isoform X3 n=1 Tax=Syzygium oleosum TaxID=219896 RepID=UPI0024BBE0A0|nr:uncharacterized protein LOC130135569 isoform X3 [Syzygium oleosum]